MSEREQETISRIAEAMRQLPESKKEYLIGYAEGVVAMSEDALRRSAEEMGVRKCKTRPTNKAK